MGISSAAIRAGAAYVELYVKNNKYIRGLQVAERGLKSFGAGVMRIGAAVTAVGAAMVGSILVAAKGFAAFGDTLNKMAIRTGVSVEALQELKFAAEQSGASIDSLGDVLQKMNRRFGRVTAGEGSNTQVDAIEKLGLSVEHLNKLDAEGRFLAIADAMAKYGDNAAAAGLAQRIFGTGVDKLLPLIFAGADGIEKLRKECRELGIVLSKEDTDAAAELTDAWNRMTKVLGAVKMIIGAAVAPTITELIGRIVEAAKGVRMWIDENRPLVVGMLKVGAAVAAAGAIIMGIGIGIFGAGVAFGLLVSIITAILSPIGLVVIAVVAVGAGLAALGGYALYTTGVLGPLWDSFKAGAKVLGEDFGRALDGIVAALSTGDIKGAVEILWVTILLEFKRGEKKVTEVWFDFLDKLLGPVFRGRRIQAEKEITEELNTQIGTLDKILDRETKRAQKAQDRAKKKREGGATDDADSTATDRLQQLIDRLRQTEIGTIQDVHDRAIAQIKDRYAIELREGEKSIAAKRFLEKNFLAEIAAEEERHRAEKAAGQLRIEGDFQAQMARLQIETTKKGHERAMGLLTLERKEALKAAKEAREAGKAALSAEQVNRLFDLREQVLGLEKEPRFAQSKTTSTLFGSVAMRMGGGSTQDRIAAATEETVEKVQEVKAELANFMGFAFT